ncbi:MAG: glycoside hydrolase family 28 protein, partial [Clostridia bacterium]|nr:glycoside hydrolase family 28 protein [Clostridia bacterium]
INMFYFCDPDGKTEYVWSKEKRPVGDDTPYLGAFEFRNIRCENTEWCAGYVYGLPEQPVGSVTFDDVTVTFDKNAQSGKPAMMTDAEELKNGGFYFRNVKKVVMKNVKMSGAAGDNVVMSGVESAEGIENV